MYSNIDTIDQLRARVQELEQQQKAEWKEMRNEVREQYERLKPANLIRNAFDDLTGNFKINPEADILNEGAGLVTGMLVNTIMSGSKNKALKKWLSVALFSVATYFISRHREDILNAGNKVMAFISDRMDMARANRAARKARKEAEDDMDDETYDEIPDYPEEDIA